VEKKEENKDKENAFDSFFDRIIALRLPFWTSLRNNKTRL